jgi:predicted lipoprotein
MIIARTSYARYWQSLLLLLLIGLPSYGYPGETRYHLYAVDRYVLPGYLQLNEQIEHLARNAVAFCRAPDEEGLQRVRRAYHLAMDSWQFIQPIRFGPIEKALRGYRLQFWPDKRQSVGRHLATLLEKADSNALKQRTFAKGSVAVQGFSALERLLFESDTTAKTFTPSTDGGFRCQVVVAISQNLTEIAHSLVREWWSDTPTHRQLIATADRGNAAYGNSSEVSGQLFNNLYTQIELMLEQKLHRPLGNSLDRSRGRRSESWRSRRSLRNLERNLDGLAVLMKSAFLERLLDPDLNRRIDNQLIQCRERLKEIETPLLQAVTQSEQRPRVEALIMALAELKNLVINQLAPALEIPIGFNSLDGD